MEYYTTNAICRLAWPALTTFWSCAPAITNGNKAFVVMERQLQRACQDKPCVIAGERATPRFAKKNRTNICIQVQIFYTQVFTKTMKRVSLRIKDIVTIWMRLDSTFIDLVQKPTLTCPSKQLCDQSSKTLCNCLRSPQELSCKERKFDLISLIWHYTVLDNRYCVSLVCIYQIHLRMLNYHNILFVCAIVHVYQ